VLSKLGSRGIVRIIDGAKANVGEQKPLSLIDAFPRTLGVWMRKSFCGLAACYTKVNILLGFRAKDFLNQLFIFIKHLLHPSRNTGAAEAAIVEQVLRLPASQLREEGDAVVSAGLSRSVV